MGGRRGALIGDSAQEPDDFAQRGEICAPGHVSCGPVVSLAAGQWFPGPFSTSDPAFMKSLFISILSPLLASLPLAASPDGGGVLWYDEPAPDWNSALPIGNGSLGAMIFGNPEKEHLQFNEQTLWTGDEKEMGAYQPFGDLLIDVPTAKGYQALRRSLNLADALHEVEYTVGDVKFRREMLSSRPDRVIAIRLSADQPKSISARVRMASAHKAPVEADGDMIWFAGRFSNGLLHEARARVVATGGQVQASSGALDIKGADEVLILLSAATSFENSPGAGWRGENPGVKLDRVFKAIAGKDFEEIKKDHVADHRRLYDRFSIDLGGGRDELPTDERLAAYHKSHDPGLDALFFQYGRYLLIGSSRPGGLPANLQGIWNKDHKPAWYSGYTTNINVEMNYWLAEPTGLTECHLPLLDWIENLATVRKKNTQPAIAAKRGWIIYSTNNPMGGNSTWGIHRPGSAWLSQHFWTHYQYTVDKEFLRKRAYPILKELCEYWEDYLVEDKDGRLISPTGWSPEHGPVKKNGKVVLQEGNRDPQPGASYDQQIVWDLFTNYIEASRELGIDESYRKRITDMRGKLAGPKIGRWGQLQEWLEDVDDRNNRHRHVSHLFGVHPGRQITPLGTPDLAAAARVSLEARGDGGTGWSKAWKINFWARLGDGDRAHRLLKGLLLPVGGANRGGGVYRNLFDAHPPFQIDGNFGATAGMTEMLLQSHLREDDGSYVIHLLPALPTAWKSGAVKGLRARGGLKVDLAWRDGKLAAATIQSAKGGTYQLCVGGVKETISLAPGASHIIP